MYQLQATTEYRKEWSRRSWAGKCKTYPGIALSGQTSSGDPGRSDNLLREPDYTIMNCIIVDDEPLAREGIRLLVEKNKELLLVNSFSNANAAGKFLTENKVGLVFLDIRMPGVNGIEFARTISSRTLVIFTTAYAEF